MQKNNSCLPGGGKMKQWIACCVAAVAAVASGGLRTNDYSWVRGTHYYPTNDAAVIARELGYGKRVGLKDGKAAARGDPAFRLRTGA